MIDLGRSRESSGTAAAGPENKAPQSGAATFQSAKAAENERLAEALRENLRRRKAQERGRRAATDDPAKSPG